MIREVSTADLLAVWSSTFERAKGAELEVVDSVAGVAALAVRSMAPRTLIDSNVVARLLTVSGDSRRGFSLGPRFAAAEARLARDAGFESWSTSLWREVAEGRVPRIVRTFATSFSGLERSSSRELFGGFFERSAGEYRRDLERFVADGEFRGRTMILRFEASPGAEV